MPGALPCRPDAMRRAAARGAQRVAERGPVLEVERPGARARRRARPACPRRRRRPPRSTPPGSASRARAAPAARWRAAGGRSRRRPLARCTATPPRRPSSARPGSSTRPARESITTMPRAADVAPVAPARAGDLAVGAEGEVAHERVGVAAAAAPRGSSGPRRDPPGDRLPEVLVDPVGHEGRRRSARPTRPWRVSRRPRRPRCSSRRARRGRRRSSRWGRSTAASAPTGSVHDSRYRRQYSSKSATCMPGRLLERRAALG